MAELKTTALLEAHAESGAKFVPFAGWQMPVQYAGLREEHTAVRTSAGIFDVSHMGEVFFRGEKALDSLQYLTTNDVSKLVDGGAQYSAILNEKGGIIDDIIVYRLAADEFMVCVNASNTEAAFNWFQSKNPIDSVQVTNESAAYSQIALQGPAAMSVLEAVIPDAFEQVGSLKPFRFSTVDILGSSCLVARTGYTGEDGVEIFCPWAAAPGIWTALLSQQGVTPCGLGARDTLRLEVCYPLHGHELGEEISALESGLGWVVKFDKGDFIGKQALLEQKEAGVPRKLAGFFIEGRGIAREGVKVLSEAGEEIGIVTSGTMTPTVGKALGIALISSDFSALDTKIGLEVRGKVLDARVVKKPFYKR